MKIKFLSTLPTILRPQQLSKKKKQLEIPYNENWKFIFLIIIEYSTTIQRKKKGLSSIITNFKRNFFKKLLYVCTQKIKNDQVPLKKLFNLFKHKNAFKQDKDSHEKKI